MCMGGLKCFSGGDGFEFGEDVPVVGGQESHDAGVVEEFLM